MKIKELNAFVNAEGNIVLAQEGQIIEITPDMVDLVVQYLKDLEMEARFPEQEKKEQL